MPVRVQINEREFRRRFRSLRAKSIAFGVKNASDRAGRFLVKSFQREWRRKLDARRQSFPRSVMRVKKALVNAQRGVVTRPTRVFNIAADEALRAQIRGATRSPKKSEFFAIPTTGKARRVSRRLKTYIADKYIFAYSGRGSRLVGVLEREIKVKGTLDFTKVLRSTQRTFQKLTTASLNQELRRRQR